MIYCFDKDLNFDYSEQELKIAKELNIAILYDRKRKVFMDFAGNSIDITGMQIFPRTGCLQIYDLISEINKNGGISIVSDSEIKQVLSWPKYYKTFRKIMMLYGKDLLNSEYIPQIEGSFGSEFFLKTKDKNFSEIIDISLLKDEECAFYKALKHHLNDEFIISEKVNICEDELGTIEYRCFVIDGQIANISRNTTSVFHRISDEALMKLRKIVHEMEDVLPNSYVVDIFKYEKDGKIYFDVIEFNPIFSSGLYLYNSCLIKSSDLLHDNMEAIAQEFMDKLSECTYEGDVLSGGHTQYDMPNSFANDLKCICVTGNIGGFCSLNITPESFKRHKPILDFSGFKVSSDAELHGRHELDSDEMSLKREKNKRP